MIQNQIRNSMLYYIEPILGIDFVTTIYQNTLGIML